MVVEEDTEGWRTFLLNSDKWDEHRTVVGYKGYSVQTRVKDEFMILGIILKKFYTTSLNNFCSYFLISNISVLDKNTENH